MAIDCLFVSTLSRITNAVIPFIMTGSCLRHVKPGERSVKESVTDGADGAEMK